MLLRSLAASVSFYAPLASSCLHSKLIRNILPLRFPIRSFNVFVFTRISHPVRFSFPIILVSMCFKSQTDKFCRLLQIPSSTSMYIIDAVGQQRCSSGKWVKLAWA
ncbi:hypothetical protein T4C_7056 [Trichinella pseudospiralis]|uniref:Uncharacterized protein n=1 Tax=Trichinella pseudospiralis TaxID=6337 RepID=A0A0V1JLR4_TRIPS|nr:hypothetical protein T4C_7056 [Trichinella pseudospiralis]